ncbi:MAG: sigma 54-interacting transcriptional regulator, partial [Candidatus Latescibacterota bacterium]
IGQDRQGHLVFCTQGGGVGLFDDEVLQRLTRRDGLSSDVVKDFLQDEDGAYWFATELGLTRYRPSARGPSVRLSEVMADQTYHPPFPRGMGPSDYGAEPRPDPTGSSSPRRRARARPAGAEGVAPEATGPSGQLPDPLAIPTSQACLRIAFEGSSLTSRPDALAYRYRLVGLEPDWSVTREREVTYSHLPRGTYAFEVQAVDPDLQRSEAATLALEVIPDPRDEALAEAFRQSAPSGDLVGRSPATARLQQQLHEVADSDATVLLMGETGTGKGLAARCLHELSARRDGPFVQVNCGAIALSLIESELFGHERGAFTDAHTRKLGKVELAAGGTLFLDEIGEMHTDAQVRLLRLLEERTYERVGGTQTHWADVRVVAATNRDLPQLVQAGGFREDLYFRLSVFPIALPALRDRGKDIDLLAAHFLAAVSRPRRQPPPEITPAALAALRRHAWPGNIRELRNVLERATLVCRGQPIEPEHLALGLQGGREQAGAAGSGAWPSLDEHERAYLLEVLEATAWRVSGPRGAAHLLGMPESTLRSRLASLGIRRPGKT